MTVGIERCAPPNRGHTRVGVAIEFGRAVLSAGTPGVWYRSDKPVHKNALVDNAKAWADAHGVILELHQVDGASTKELRLHGRVASVDDLDDDGNVRRTHYDTDGEAVCVDRFNPVHPEWHERVYAAGEPAAAVIEGPAPRFLPEQGPA